MCVPAPATEVAPPSAAEGRVVMTSSFTVRSAAGYEQLMGRWSRVLAGPFIGFAGVAGGERVLDVGCGTGSLTFALPQAADVAEVAAIDYAPVFVEEAQRRKPIHGSPSRSAMRAPFPSRTAGSIARCRCWYSISCPTPTG